MRAGIATQTNRFEVYDGATGERLKGITNVTLPAFELASNEFGGAGVAGSINVPARGKMNAQTATISFSKLYGPIATYLALGTTRRLDIRVDTAVVDPASNQLINVPERWVIEGPISKADPGKLEGAAAGDGSIDMQVYFAQHWQDGDELLEWAPLNSIHRVNGVDLLATQRNHLQI